MVYTRALSQPFTCPSVTRKVGDKEVTLRMDFDAISAAEQITGKNLLDEKVWADMDARTLTAVYWAAAKHADPTLSLGAVRAASFKEMPEMIQAIRAAWRASNDMPEEDSVPTSGSKSPENADASVR